MYPGSEKPFFLSIGSLKITNCSKRKTRLSFARERKLLSCSVTVKVSCCSSLPRAVILPWYQSENREMVTLYWTVSMTKFFTDCEEWSKFLGCTSKPCSLPTFIMSLQRFGTKHITSTAFCCRDKKWELFRNTAKFWYLYTPQINSRTWKFQDTNLQLLRVHPSFCVILQEVLLK